MGEVEINAFLTHAAVKGRVAASTQNQALAAFLPGYLLQIVEHGYAATAFEIDAQAHERTDL